jgi:dihydrofolate reductase
MQLNLIVARDKENHAIGMDGNIPWHIKEDLQHFKKLTDGNIVIMGRKTMLSIRAPLPNRLNIVISGKSRKSVNLKRLTKFQTVNTPEEALTLVDEYNKEVEKPVFIIGGESVYHEFLAFADVVYLTEVCKSIWNKPIVGDVTFDYDFVENSSNWTEEVLGESLTGAGPYFYRFLKYTRIR